MTNRAQPRSHHRDFATSHLRPKEHKLKALGRERMDSRQYAVVAAPVFTVVAIVQALRLFYGSPVIVGSAEIPMAVSWVAVFVAGLLAIAGFTKARS